MEVDPLLCARCGSEAIALAHMGREEEALAAIDKTIQASPQREYGYRNRAWLLFLIGRLDEALAAIDKAVEVEPGTYLPYRTRAAFLAYKPGSCARSETDLRKAMELEGSSAQAQLDVTGSRLADFAFACPEAVQPGPSLKLAQELVSGFPGVWSTHSILGLALYHNGRFEEARAALAKTLTFADIGDYDPLTRFWLAMTEAKLGRKADSRKDYARAVERMNVTWPKAPHEVRLKAEAGKVLGL